MSFDFPQAEQYFVKLESDSYGNNIISNNNILKNNSIDILKVNNNEYITTSEFDNNIQPQYSVKSVVSPGSDNGSVYDHLSPQNYNVTGISSYSIEHPSALSVNNQTEINYSNVSSPSPAEVKQSQNGMTTPEGSVCSSKSPAPKLSLNINLKPTTTSFDLATPNIIEEVVGLETNQFNILEYMQTGVSFFAKTQVI